MLSTRVNIFSTLLILSTIASIFCTTDSTWRIVTDTIHPHLPQKKDTSFMPSRLMPLTSNIPLSHFILDYKQFLFPKTNLILSKQKFTSVCFVNHNHPLKKVELMPKKRDYDTMTSRAMMRTSSTSTFDNLEYDKKHENIQCKKLIIVLAGPTAVGKSSVGSRICSPEMATDIMINHAKYNTIYKSNNIIGDSKKVREGIKSQKENHILSSCGHIISADSVQAYQGVQIGANKPSKEELEKTPHHLIDIVNGDSVCQYNAASWMNDALHVIEKLTHYSQNNKVAHSEHNEDLEANEQCSDGMESEENEKRQKRIEKYLSEQLDALNDGQQVLPVIVGGTMMYLQWLVHGRPDAMKPTEDALKKAASTLAQFLQQEEEFVQLQESLNENQRLETTLSEKENNGATSGWKAAIDHVSSLGQIFADRASKLSGKDWYRLRRTLEVAYTVLDDAENKVKIEEIYNGQREGGLDSSEYDVRCFFLCPDDRMSHTSVVDSRCEAMIEKGLIKETADLCLSGQLPEGGQQARAIGYRQTLDYLNRKDVKEKDATAFASYLDEFTGATRRYAKKQMQWFRRDEKFLFVPVKLSDPSSERVESSARIIRDMCVLSREDFEKELSHPGDNCDVDSYPISTKTKIENEKQGKTMKFYRGKRHKFIEGSDDYNKMISDADKHTSRMQI